MPESKQLPYLISLLDDESVRATIKRELAAFGPSLETELEALNIRLTSEQAKLIRPLLDEHYRDWITSEWRRWELQPTDKSRLEYALTLIARFQLGKLYPARLKLQLDDLADEYDTRYAQRDELDLAEFLFQGYGLRGTSQESYYDPLNSNLVHVISEKRGIPISLACIYILVGDRLDLNIEGCNFPGHFLAIASTRRQQVIVDCFSGGTRINQESLTAIDAQVTERDILRMQCGANTIVARVLRNLISAYEQCHQREHASTMAGLLAQFERQ